MRGLRRDLRYLADWIGPRMLVVVIVAAALVGAVVCAVIEVVHQYGLPHSPKGTPPS